VLPVPLASRRSGSRIRRPLATAVEDDDAGAHEFCAPTEEPAGFDIFDNDREAKSMVTGAPFQEIIDSAQKCNLDRARLKLRDRRPEGKSTLCEREDVIGAVFYD
jgi:hypothetical protein